MEFIIDNISALRFWSHAQHSLESCSSPCARRTLKGASASPDAFEKLGANRLGIGPEPFHLLTSKSGRRLPSSKIICHVRAEPLPKGAFRRLGPELLVASPELSFLEMALILPLPKLAEYGCFLCGTYAIQPDAAATNDRKPLTTKRKLERFIDQMSGSKGCKQARRALPSIIEASASPYETKLMLLLAMPTKQGGYGFPLPQFNRRIAFTSHERRLYGRPYVVLDLYWRDRSIGIEYDGQAHHSSKEDLERDRRKTGELSCKGITVLRVDRRQLASPSSVYVLARKLARLMGRQIHPPTPQQWRIRRSTYNQLMGTSR